MNKANPPSPIIRCPRCGYDQRGVVDTWKESCPLRSVCSECGLEIEWAQMLSEKARVPRWNVECTRFARSVPWRSITTLVRSLWPWSLWRSLQMHHEIRYGRLAAYFVCLLFSMYIGFAVIQGLISARFWISLQGVGAVSSPGVPPGVVTPQVGLLEAVCHSLVAPLSTQSTGGMTWSGIPIDYPAPAAFLSHRQTSLFMVQDDSAVWRRQSGYWMRFNVRVMPGVSAIEQVRDGWIDRLSTDAVPMLSFCIKSLAISTIAFVLLPQSRRQAKVRWAHIVRVFIYAVALLPAMMSVFVLIDQFGTLTFIGGVTRPFHWLIACFLLWPLFMCAWWSAATRRYLRMPHAWGIAVAVVALGVLGALLTGSLFTVAWMMT